MSESIGAYRKIAENRFREVSGAAEWESVERHIVMDVGDQAAATASTGLKVRGASATIDR